jgi:copper chaperone CopZ
MMDMVENMLAVIVMNDTTTMKLYIKNMVCSRCKMVVKSKLEKLGLHPILVELGEVDIQVNNIENIKAVFALVRIPTHH